MHRRELGVVNQPVDGNIAHGLLLLSNISFLKALLLNVGATLRVLTCYCPKPIKYI